MSFHGFTPVLPISVNCRGIPVDLPPLRVYMFSNLATGIFDLPRVRFCAPSTADMKAGGLLAIVESDDLLTAPMEGVGDQ